MQAYGYSGSFPGLPDPELDRQFYEGVAARRCAAWVIDLFIILALGIPVAVVFGIATLGFGFALFSVLISAVGFLYRTATITGGSATWGMRMMGIEFRRADGTLFDFGTALLHTALYTLAFTIIILQFASCLAMIGTRYGQGLPDLLLRTTVINRPAD